MSTAIKSATARNSDLFMIISLRGSVVFYLHFYALTLRLGQSAVRDISRVMPANGLTNRRVAETQTRHREKHS